MVNLAGVPVFGRQGGLFVHVQKTISGARTKVTENAHFYRLWNGSSIASPLALDICT
jgi:hypothetical protein